MTVIIMQLSRSRVYSFPFPVRCTFISRNLHLFDLPVSGRPIDAAIRAASLAGMEKSRCCLTTTCSQIHADHFVNSSSQIIDVVQRKPVFDKIANQMASESSRVMHSTGYALREFRRY